MEEAKPAAEPRQAAGLLQLHAWYDQIHFKDASPLAQGGGDEA